MSTLFLVISSCNELNNTTGLSNLALRLGADVPRPNDEGDLGETA
jgi:hypothetical protein